MNRSLLLLALVACDRDESVRPDAAGIVVSGCDDPALWTSPALEPAQAYFDVNRGSCGAQLPLHRAQLFWAPRDRVLEEAERARYDRVCWRVTDASPGSGWTAGQTFSTGLFDPANPPAMNLMGFARPVTIEGRVLRDDGMIEFATDPMAVELDQATISEPDASGIVAAMSPYAWAERDALYLWTERVATDEVLDATQFDYNDVTTTLHRVGTDLVWRRWRHEAGQYLPSDFVIGPGTRGRLGPGGSPVIVDDEVVVLGLDANHNRYVERRVQLGAEPLEVADFAGYTIVHVPGSLVLIGDSEDATMTVGDGVLLSSIFPESPMFFDGSTFHGLRWTTQLSFDEFRMVTPRPEDLAMLGKPVAYLDGVVIGEHGFLMIGYVAPGPTFASFADVFGDGELGPVSVTKPAYVIKHADGSAALYDPPGDGYCPLE